jgi:hypothetical protein
MHKYIQIKHGSYLLPGIFFSFTSSTTNCVQQQSPTHEYYTLNPADLMWGRERCMLIKLFEVEIFYINFACFGGERIVGSGTYKVSIAEASC